MMKKVLIISDLKSERISTSVLRLYDFAWFLSKDNLVYLFIPNKNKILSLSENIKLIEDDVEQLKEAYKESDVLIGNGLIYEKYDFIECDKIPIIYDGYDPFVLEKLNEDSSKTNRDILEKIIVRSDYFLCASETQKNYWIGMLSVYNRVNPIIYREDNKLKNLIDVVGVKYSAKDILNHDLENYVLCELDEDTNIEMVIDCFINLKDIDLNIICRNDKNLDRIYNDIKNDINSLGYENIFITRYEHEDVRFKYICCAKIILNICKDTLKSRFKPKDSLRDYLEYKKLIICTPFNYLPDNLKVKKAIVILNEVNSEDLHEITCELINNDNLYNEYIFNLDVFLKTQEDYLLKLDDIVNNAKISIDKNYLNHKEGLNKKNLKSNFVFLKNMIQKGISMIFKG